MLQGLMDGLNVIAKTTLDLFFNDNKMDYMFKEIGMVNKKGHTPRLRKTINGVSYTAYLFTIPIGLSIKDFEQNIDALAQGMKEDIRDMNVDLVNNQALITVKRENKEISYDYESYDFDDKLRIPLGVNLLTGKVVYWNFTEPEETHAILGGSTGCGKSTMLRVMLSHMIGKLSNYIEIHAQDTKILDLPEFKDTASFIYYQENKEGIYEELVSLVSIMNERNKEIKELGAKDIREYNEKCKCKKMKYKFLIIEELASFNKEDKSDIEGKFYPNMTELLTKGRAAGIQVIFTCQTPYNKTFPGEIKNNVNAVIGMRCNTGEASKSICGDFDALTCLKGKGHSKFFAPSGTVEIQGFNIKDVTIKKIVKCNSKK